MGLQQALEHARNQTEKIEQQGAQLTQFQAEEAAFEKRLTAAGLSIAAFEADVAVTAQPFGKVIQALKQEFPTMSVGYRFQAQPERSRPQTQMKDPIPLTAEAIEQASQMSSSRTMKSEENMLLSAQGAAASEALVSLAFTLDLSLSCEQDMLGFLNRLIHLIPGVITFDHLEIRKQGMGLTSSKQFLPQNPRRGAFPYTATIHGQIATHPDEARVLAEA